MFVEAPMIQAVVQEAGERARIRGECNLNRIESIAADVLRTYLQSLMAASWLCYAL